MTSSCLVTQRLGVYAADGLDDADSQPDWVPISGKVKFVPNVRPGDSFLVTDENGEKTVPAVTYVAEIRAGILYHNDEVGIRLFAAGPNSNPKKISYKAQYFGLTAHDVPITLRDVVFEAVPGGHVDLTAATPVAGTPAMGITRGAPGPAPYIGNNGNWWVDGKDLGVAVTGPEGYPGIAPYVKNGNWWVKETDLGVSASGPQGVPGPTGTLDLIDESIQTTIDTVAIPAIEGARDEALGQVEDAVAAEIGNTTNVISSGDTSHANKVVRLGANGKLHIGQGTVVNSTDPAGKHYVDLAVGGKSNVGHTHNGGDILNGTTQYVNYSDDRFADQLVRLNAAGKFHITTAGITDPNDPVNKQYVDNVVGSGSSEIGATTHVISSGDATHAWKVVRLSETGKLHIGMGTVVNPTDPANKQYVDLEVGKRSPSTHTHRGSDIVSETTQYANYSDDRFANQLLKLNAAGKFHITTAGITGLNDPVNKQYVDTAVSAGSPGSGQTMWWN